MALRLSVEGSRDKVSSFVDFLQMSPQWRFYNRTRLSMGGDELRMDYFLDENPYMKPTVSTRQINKLFVTSKDGKQIEITLLDAEIADMGNGITYIHGKSYDIFASQKTDTPK